MRWGWPSTASSAAGRSGARSSFWVAGSWSCRAAPRRRQHRAWRCGWRGTGFVLGGVFLEWSGRAAASPAPGMALWLQVRELAAVRRELGERGVPILQEPKREPWGLLEMWIADPDGVRICIVEVPEEHPLRRR